MYFTEYFFDFFSPHLHNTYQKYEKIQFYIFFKSNFFNTRILPLSEFRKKYEGNNYDWPIGSQINLRILRTKCDE